MANCVIETYKNSIMPYVKNIFNTEYDMDMARMCTYPSLTYEFTYWKYVLWCCTKCSNIDLPSP